MKDYKRLTNDWFDCRRCPNGECENPDTFCVFRERCEEHNRLKRLEDKIESGELGDVSELQKACEYWKDKVKEYQRRAEVAERALRNAAPRLNCRGGLGKGFCRVDKCDYYHCNNDEGCVKAHLQQAEKELAEEDK